MIPNGDGKSAFSYVGLQADGSRLLVGVHYLVNPWSLREL